MLSGFEKSETFSTPLCYGVLALSRLRVANRCAAGDSFAQAGQPKSTFRGSAASGSMEKQPATKPSTLPRPFPNCLQNHFLTLTFAEG
jgi:hypothetical protein